ncbi:MAG: DUF1963 domain-containing protein [Parabacteroides sp.]|nr:DUF1963 domain-containing protein [Parabacteroides sp.]
MKDNALEEYLSEIEAADYNLPVSAILFQKNEEGKPWESKLGGCPYLPSKEEYPIGENGKPMLFMAQINLKEVPPISILPDHGLLQFFVCQDDSYGAYAPSLVRYIEEITESENELLTVHPFMDEAYQEALPFENPCRITFADTEDSEDEDEESQIGGYPYFPQDGDFEPDEDFVLLQLVDDPNINFGDCGACRFLINLEDLANCNFSDVIYSWDCC